MSWSIWDLLNELSSTSTNNNSIKGCFVSNARYGATQYLPNGVGVLMSTVFSNVEYDPFGWFDSTTGKITVSENGFYLIIGGCMIERLDANAVLDLWFKVNGLDDGDVGRIVTGGVQSHNATYGINARRLNAGDYVQLYASVELVASTKNFYTKYPRLNIFGVLKIGE